MEEQELQVSKLGFFQRLRKNFYLRNMSPKKASKYYNLPEYLKQDEEVASAVVMQNEFLINHVPFGSAQKLISANPELMKTLYDVQRKIQMLNVAPELGAYLEEYEIFNFAYDRSLGVNGKFIRFTPQEVQEKMLLEDSISYLSLPTDKIASVDKNKNIGNRRSLNIADFSESAILKFAISEEQKRLEAEKNFRRYTPKTFQMDLTKLPEEVQLKLLFLSSEYSSKLSPEIVEKFVGDNPLLFDMLSPEMQRQKIIDNPELLARLPMQEQFKYLQDYSLKILPENTRVQGKVKNYSGAEVAKKDLIQKRYMQFSFDSREMTDLRDDSAIWEMGKFDPRFIELSDSYGQAIRNMRLQKNIYEHLRLQNPNGPITRFFETDGRYYNSSDLEKKNRMIRLIANDDITSRVSQEQLFDYANNPTHEKLVEIVRSTYGDESAQILMDRPSITIEQIPNMYVFHPEIIHEFSPGAVHATLSYSMNASAEFSEFARFPEKLAQYKKFSAMTEGFFEDTAVDLDRKIISFEYARKLLEQMPTSQITDAQKENLFLAISDVISSKEQTVLAFPTNMQELESYKEKRAKIYDDALSKINDPMKIKECISERFFGLQYTDGRNSHYSNLTKNNVVDMCRFYNLSRFANSEQTLQSGNFSQDDLDALEVLDIIRSIDNPAVLRDIASSLEKNESVINVRRYDDLSRRVPRQYTQEFVNQLISPEKAEEMISRGEQGISEREVDGIKIITLDGADFLAYITNPFLNNSNIHRVVMDEEAVKTWRNLESGISTFSGCAIDQDEAKSTIGTGERGLGFSKVHPSQIIAMSSTDAHLSHGRKELETSTTESLAIEFNYPEELMRETARRLEGDDKFHDPFHKYNEVASLRRETELSKIEPGTNGGRVEPDYIYTYGKKSGERGLSLAKAFGLKYIIEYNDEAYRGRAWARGNAKQASQVERPQSEFIKDIKSKAKEDDSSER